MSGIQRCTVKTVRPETASRFAVFCTYFLPLFVVFLATLSELENIPTITLPGALTRVSNIVNLANKDKSPCDLFEAWGLFYRVDRTATRIAERD